MSMRFRRSLSASLAAFLAGGALVGSLATAPAAMADSWRDKEHWLKESGITNAWQVSKGAGVKVAIIDSGVDGNHPDLKGVVTGGADASKAGAPNGQKSIGAKPEHGTLVATMLAGRGHTTTTASPSASPSAAPTTPPAGGPDGIVGVAPEAELLSVSTWLGSPNPGGKTDQEQIPDAVRWAVDNGAKVINISLGSTSPDWPQSWDAAFLYAEQRTSSSLLPPGTGLAATSRWRTRHHPRGPHGRRPGRRRQSQRGFLLPGHQHRCSSPR